MRHVTLVAIAIVAALLAPFRMAAGQDVVEQAGPFAIPISMKSVDKMGAVLNLTPDQRSIVKTLYAGYRAEFKQAVSEGDAEVKALDEKFQADGSQDYMGHMKQRNRITRTFVDKIGKLEKSLLDDVKAVLTAEQAPLFDRAQRGRRREVGLRFSIIAGEGVDVLEILRSMKVEAAPGSDLGTELERYELDLDKSMVAKDKMLHNMFDQMDKLDGPEPDPELIKKMMEEFVNSGIQLRDLHRQAVRKISPMLTPDQQQTLDRRVKKESFPRVYGESPAEKMIKAAKEMSDLSADQKTELASIEETFRREADAANDRWAAAVEEKQASMSKDFMAAMMGMGDDNPDDPLRKAREARKALDERTAERVQQVLKSEQKEHLPQSEGDEAWSGNEVMPDFDFQGEWEDWKKEDQPEAPAPEPK